MRPSGYLLIELIFLSFISCTSTDSETDKKKVGIVNKVTDDASHGESRSHLPVKSNEPAPDSILDVRAIINLNEDEVNIQLGDPYASEKTINGIRKYYTNERANVEVTYISKKADWIKVLPKYEIPFDKESLKYINVRPDARQTYELTKELIMLRGMKEYEEVAMYPDDKKLINYYFIKTCTPAN